MRKLAVLVACLLFATLVPSHARTPTFPGYRRTQLPTDNPHYMVRDPQTQRLFISTAHYNSEVLVLDRAGAVEAKLAVPGGPSGLALRNGELMVSSYNDYRVEVFDADTLQRLRSIPVPQPGYPARLAIAGGKLWLGTGGCLTQAESTSSIDLATEEMTTYESHSPFPPCPFFATSPARPDFLLVWWPAERPYIKAFDVSGETPILLWKRDLPHTVYTLDLSPDATRFLLATRFSLEEADALTGITLRTFEPPAEPQAVAYDPSAARFALSTWALEGEPSIFVYDRETGSIKESFVLKGSDELWQVLWHTNKPIFYGNAPGSSDSRAHFYAINLAYRRTTLHARVHSATIRPGAAVRMRVTHQDHEEAWNRKMKIVKRRNGDIRIVARGTLDSDGVFRTRIRLRRDAALQARWGGDHLFAPARSEWISINVRGRS